MPAPFSPVHIPFISGVRQDIGSIAQESPSQLKTAQNVVFTRKGQIMGRPGLLSCDAVTQTGPGLALLSSLVTAAGTDTPTGIVSTGFQSPAISSPDTPLLCFQGGSYYNRSGQWNYTGTHWSLRQTKSVALDVRDPSGFGGNMGKQVPVGKDVVGLLTGAGAIQGLVNAGNGVPFLTAQGEIEWMATMATSNTLNVATRVVAAGNALFWLSGSLRGMITQGFGPTTGNEVTYVGAAAGNALDACTDGTFYYVAVGGGGGSSNVIKINSVGTIIQTFNIVWPFGLALGDGLAICCDPTQSQLCVAAIVTNGGVGVVQSKVLGYSGGTIFDMHFDVTHTGAPNLPALPSDQVVCVGASHVQGKFSVMYSLSTKRWDTGATVPTIPGSVYIGGRLANAATEITPTILIGQVNSFNSGKVWDPLFAGRAVSNRTLAGVMLSYESVNRSSQWVVLDISSLFLSTPILTDRIVAACGPANGVERVKPSSVYSDGQSVSFGMSEGILFSAVADASPSNGSGNVSVVKRAVGRRITLATQGVQATHVNDVAILSGQLLHVFDGSRTRPHHFPEETPYIFNGGNGYSYFGAPGFFPLAQGSYTYQATWEAVNARGQTTRSGASLPLTVNVNAPNLGVYVPISTPQLWTNYSVGDVVRVRLWATQTNPTNNAPKYIVAETTVAAPSTTASVTLAHLQVSSGVEEQLYETVDTLADMRAPGADRGTTIVAERAWCADQNTLYASKIIRPNLAVSWNTEGTNIITLPSSLGAIQALSGVNQALVVLCSRGVGFVSGPGVDDTGGGPGWTLQIVDGAPGMGTSSPRACAALAGSVVYQAQDGDLWGINSSGQPMPLSRAVRDNSNANSSRPVDVVYVTPTTGTNAMLVAHGRNETLRVLDLEMGQWGTWNMPDIIPGNGQYLASINGALWLQTTAGSLIYRASGSDGTDGTGFSNITATIETGVLRPGSPAPHGWGRVRSVGINEVRGLLDSQTNILVEMFADENRKVLMSKALNTQSLDPSLFPGGTDGHLELRTTTQRCAYVTIRLTISPALFTLEGLDLWVANSGEKAPSNNRS